MCYAAWGTSIRTRVCGGRGFIPARLGADISKQETRKLYRVVQSVLREAIRFRGSSISDYVDAEGQRGWFQQRHRVYDREGKKCARCGSVIRREIVAGQKQLLLPALPARSASKRRRGALIPIASSNC